jgi:biopolymer transport protein ExbB/TolQ
MEEIIHLFRSAGWISIPLVGYSILNLGLFVGIYLRVRHWQKLKAQVDSPKELSTIEEKEALWEEISHPLVVSASWIASISGLSTLTGLFGTVLGIQKSFQDMQASGSVSLDIFAGGVSLALSTTILGLGIAIPSYFLYQIARTKISSLEKVFFK